MAKSIFADQAIVFTNDVEQILVVTDKKGNIVMTPSFYIEMMKRAGYVMVTD